MGRLALAIFVLSLAIQASGQCTQLFAAVSINAVQYPVQATHGYVPAVVSGVISLSLQFRTMGESIIPLTGISLRYTVDNQPIGPVLTDNFNWSLDTSSIPDGTHSLSVLYVNEPAPTNPWYTLLGRQYSFVVSKTSVPLVGPQKVPVIAPPPGYGPLLPQYADFVTYPGYQPRATPHPFPYHAIPPAGGATPTDLWAEPLLNATSNTGEPQPS